MFTMKWVLIKVTVRKYLQFVEYAFKVAYLENN